MMRQLWNRRRPMWCVKALGQEKQWDVVIFFFALVFIGLVVFFSFRKIWFDEGSLWHVVRAELKSAVRHSFHTFFARGPSSFLNEGADRNGMQRSCSDDSVTPACIWRVNASPRYSRTSTHWDGKNSLPIAFRRAGGAGGDVMCLVCVCLCMYVRGRVRISSGLINSRARQRGMWGHAQSPPLWSCGGGADVPSQALCLAATAANT